jgi:hypothetical protein
LNAQGGIYGRRVELAQTTLDGFSTARPPFAIVGGGIARAEQAIVAAAERQRIPFVGSQTIGLAAGATTSATFALLSGVEQQHARWSTTADAADGRCGPSISPARSEPRARSPKRCGHRVQSMSC